jgi:hypothetical protein
LICASCDELVEIVNVRRVFDFEVHVFTTVLVGHIVKSIVHLKVLVVTLFIFTNFSAFIKDIIIVLNNILAISSLTFIGLLKIDYFDHRRRNIPIQQSDNIVFGQSVRRNLLPLLIAQRRGKAGLVISELLTSFLLLFTITSLLSR